MRARAAMWEKRGNGDKSDRQCGGAPFRGCRSCLGWMRWRMRCVWAAGTTEDVEGRRTQDGGAGRVFGVHDTQIEYRYLLICCFALVFFNYNACLSLYVTLSTAAFTSLPTANAAPAGRKPNAKIRTM